LRRLLENAFKLGVLTVLLVVLIFLWLRESAPTPCIRAQPQCRPPPPRVPAAAPLPPPPRAPPVCRPLPSSGR
jgi:hypothetical protein